MKKAKQTTLTGAAAVISAVCILYAVISFLVYVAARNTPDTVYMLYTSKIYRIVTFPDKLISSVIPFSVSETLLILIITVFLAGFMLRS